MIPNKKKNKAVQRFSYRKESKDDSTSTGNHHAEGLRNHYMVSGCNTAGTPGRILLRYHRRRFNVGWWGHECGLRIRFHPEVVAKNQ
jgi:hypothetical protein